MSAEGHSLVMPFVVCSSQGGEYADTPFVAGVQFGRLYEAMRENGRLGTELEGWVKPGIVPQLDLAAMEFGYTMVVKPWDEHPDEWVFVSFTAGSPASKDGQQ